ncbi:MAG: hypothetical protein K0Q50_896 [Vampirovibrio sp.]|jgi:tetratricopeptide (TPR) repeat protein|nr:hypothetical protein [Vampirovibrio sp.]
MLEMHPFRLFVTQALPLPPARRLRLALASAGLAGCLSMAYAADLTQLNYQNGALSLTVSGKSGAPSVDVWPGNTDPNPSELVILKLPDAQGDVSTLQQAGNLALQAHPELKKFLVGPLNSDASEKRGIKIVLEVQTPPGASTVPPLVSKVGKTDWLVTILPGLSHDAPPSASSRESSPSDKQKGSEPAPALLPNKADVSRKITDSAGNAGALSAPASPPTCPTAPGAGEILQLQKALEAGNRQRDALQQRLSQYEELIRQYAPETLKPDERDAATIQNLRSALLKVAGKLKATEEALTAQTAKTRELESRLTQSKPFSAPAAVVTSAHPQLAEPGEQKTGTQRVYSANSDAERTDDAKLALASVPGSPAITDNREKALLLEDIIRENPRKYNIYIELADLYQSRGDITAAENILTLLLRQNPAYSMGYGKLAMLYAGANRIPEAQTALDSYQRLKPDDQQTLEAIRHAMRNSVKTPANSTTGPKKSSR